MAKRKKAVKKKAAPKRITYSVTKRTTIGKVSKPVKRKNSGYHMKAAKEMLYGELGNLYVKKEKAAKKAAKKKISKLITEKKRQINRLK